MAFPTGFRWGAATAAYQIEGATRRGGRGESIWDRFAAIPGSILTGETAEPACCSYDRPEDDVALLSALGLNAYRFSVAWPRIVPDGDGAVNEAGLAYYSDLVDRLLAAGIEPFVTLYHWDLPQALQDQGGWADRRTIDAFVRYAGIVVDRLGDRVRHWMTFNEPWCVAILGHLTGDFAPGVRDARTALAVAHHVLVAHGLTVPEIRRRCPGAQVGIALNFEPADPATDSPADAAAVRLHHESFNLWFLDPLAGRGYPRTAWASYGDAVPDMLPGDLGTVAAPIDFLAVNFYSRKVLHVRGTPEEERKFRVLHRRNPRNMMARGWEVHPESLADLLHWLHRDYGFPALYVSENGATYDDVVWEGQVHDLARLDYLRRHIGVLPGVLEQGVPLRGYFCWSLMDNFEWTSGTRDRFGLVHVDFETGRRLVKDSGTWYARVARTNGGFESLRG